MKEQEEIYLIDARPRQIGREAVLKAVIAELEAQGKKVAVIGMDSPRPHLLGAAMAHIGDPDMHTIDTSCSHFQGMLKEANPKLHDRPSVGETYIRTRLLMYELGRWPSPPLDETWVEMILPITSKSIEPVTEPVVKKNWRQDRMAFLDGIGGKKKH